MPVPYLRAVEVLFRQGHLKLVFATGTLALGVNMPCRTALFLGDSPFLTPLSYRQMSGRAGRRGYDNVGNVVFFDISARKVQHLMRSRIPNLRGHSMLSCSFALQMHTLYSLSSCKEAVVDTLQVVLHEPFQNVSAECKGARYSQGSVQPVALPAGDVATFAHGANRTLVTAPSELSHVPDKQLQHLKTTFYYRFAEQLLVQCGILNQATAQLHPLAALISHLSYTEPANFVLLALMQRSSASATSALDDFCWEIRSRSRDLDQASRRVLAVLCRLFNRIPLPAGYCRPSNTTGTSTVVLEDLADGPAEVIRQFNHTALQTFTQCFVALARYLRQTNKTDSVNARLPCSGLVFQERLPNTDSTMVLPYFVSNAIWKTCLMVIWHI